MTLQYCQYKHQFAHWHWYCLQANVPYSEWFDIEAVQKYHKALPLEEFMTKLAPQHWPEGRRTGYCYRYGIIPSLYAVCFGPYIYMYLVVDKH